MTGREIPLQVSLLLIFMARITVHKEKYTRANTFAGVRFE